MMTRTVNGPDSLWLSASCAAAAAGSGSSYSRPAILKTLKKIISFPHPPDARNLSSVSRELRSGIIFAGCRMIPASLSSHHASK